ncbi:hypothetical protein R5O20_03095 [Tenacibaculum maritimum]|uniref:hypothetical protein n=1 Tax=Tenacibaculum maritimum TaxID=107401 RepID=UPI00388D94C5
MNQIKIITKPILSQKLDNISLEIKELLLEESNDSKKIKKFTELKISETENLLNSCQEIDPEFFIGMLSVYYVDIFDDFYSSYGFDKPPEIKKEIKRLHRFFNSLEDVLDYLSITNSLVKSDFNNPIISIIEKSEFLLNILKELFNDKTYSISNIFYLNDINYRDGEGREIAEDLSRRGYVILKENYGDSDHVKISVKGASYIERKNKSKKSKKGKQDIDSKINKITKMLNELGCGQEIIYDELEEIKKLHAQLNKKNWREVVKGKLLDLGLSEVINKEVISKVYEILVDDKLKFLN